MAGPTYGKNPPDDRLEFGVVTPQEWRRWEEIREQWRWAEESGWDSAWVWDHFFSLHGGEGGPNLEGWTLLAALAAETSRLQLGVLVTGITHRHPAVLFKAAATVDVVSDGRLILGVGAAWNEREHEAYGIPFPPPAERVARFGEAMEMYRLLESRERVTFHGRYYRLENAPFEPKPVYGHIPILIGTTGPRMLRHVARYADQWDGGGPPERYRALSEQLDARCREIGRDPGEIRRVLSTGEEPLASEAAFRAHVAAYARVGVRTFLFDLPRAAPSATHWAIAERAIPELREAFAAGALD